MRRRDKSVVMAYNGHNEELRRTHEAIIIGSLSDLISRIASKIEFKRMTCATCCVTACVAQSLSLTRRSHALTIVYKRAPVVTDVTTLTVSEVRSPLLLLWSRGIAEIIYCRKMYAVLSKTKNKFFFCRITLKINKIDHNLIN